MLNMKILSNYLKTRTVGLLLLTGLLLSSCDKKEEVNVGVNDPADPPSTENVEHIYNFLNSNTPVNQNFSVDANSYSTVRGNEGTVITVPPNAFTDQLGNPVSGTVNFTLKEVYSPGAMITSGMMTESNGQLLVSGGELFINAQQNGSDLRLAQGKQFSVNVPSTNLNPQMQLFRGTGSGNNFNWVPDTSTNVNTCPDSSSITLGFYCFDLDSLINWINCDYFYNDPRPLTEVDIVVPQGFDRTNTLVYVYVPSINSVTQVTRYANNIFSITSGYRLPVGLNVDFIAVHADANGNLQYAYQSNTIANNHVENLSFTAVTQAQLALLLQSL